MEKLVEKKENQDVVITVKCEGESWTKQLKKEFNKKASNVVVPGFRKGKAPEAMVKSRINQAEVINNAIMHFANVAYKEAVTENQFYVYTEPQINVTKVEDNLAEFTIVFGLPPVVELGQYKNLGVALKEVKVSAKDVTEYIDNLKKQHAVMQVKEGEAKMGDTVIIDFTGYIDNAPFDGGSAKGYELELGSGSFIPGFEDQLVGIKADESRTINVKFPDNYVESLKGKAATFEVKCNDVKEKVLPELDEEFFKELNINDVKDEASLKKYAKAQVTSRKENEAKQEQLNEIVNTAVANAKVGIPSALVEKEANAQFEQIKKQIESAGLTYADYVAINGLKEEELAAKRREEAEKNIKSMIVIEKIILEEKLDVTEDDLKNEYARIAGMYNMKVEDVEKALSSNKDQFLNQLRNAKFTEFMSSNNAVKVENEAPSKVEEEKTVKKAPAKKAASTTAKKTTTSTKKTSSTTKTTKKAAPKAE